MHKPAPPSQQQTLERVLLIVPGHPSRLEALVDARLATTFEIERAHSGTEALARMQSAPRVECTVVDEKVTDMTAVQFCRMSPKSRMGQTIPVVVVVEQAARGGLEALQAGAAGFIVARLATPDSLALEIETVVSRRSASRVGGRDMSDILDALLARAPVGLAFVDRNLRHLRTNMALAALYDVPPTTLVGRRVQDVAPDLWTTLEPLYRRALEGDVIFRTPVCRHPTGEGGTPQHWWLSLYPVILDQEVVGVGILVSDITAQTEAERALFESQAALAESEERFRAIANTAPAMLWLTGRHHECSFVSQD